MDNYRRFIASYVRGENEVGVGIVEVNKDKETLAIHSLYYPTLISHRDAHVNMFQFIRNNLSESDGKVTLSLRDKRAGRGWDEPYKDKIFIKQRTNHDGKYIQTDLLARDALEHSESISEIFKEPIKFDGLEYLKERDIKNELQAK